MVSDVDDVIPPWPAPCLWTTDSRRFAVRRIYAVGRNYAEHAREMGASGSEAPFFFMKPADTLLAAQAAEQTLQLNYPPLTRDLHHEVELAVALGAGGRDLTLAQAQGCIAGCAVALDMTRRDLQAQAKAAGRPWEIGKVFEGAVPCGRLSPRADAPQDAAIRLHVNGTLRQQGRTTQMIANVPAIIQALSRAWTLAPGDLILTGTPAGVSTVQVADELLAQIDGLESLQVCITPPLAP